MLSLPLLSMLLVGGMVWKYFIQLPRGYPQILYLLAVVVSALSFVSAVLLWLWVLGRGGPVGIPPALVLTLVCSWTSTYVGRILSSLKEPNLPGVGFNRS